MAKSNTSIQKNRGRGRPPRLNGVDPVVPVRLPKDVLAQLDKWADTNQATRSEAIRRILAKALRGK